MKLSELIKKLDDESGGSMSVYKSGDSQRTLLDRLDAVPRGAVFLYRAGVFPKIMRGAGELCAEAAREIVRLKADVKHWIEARRVAISCGEMMQEELKKLKDELKSARDEVDRLREEVSAMSKDAQRWRYLERNASVGFTGPPSYDAVVRLKVFSISDSTISAVVDRAIAEGR
jgi:hypothetical protein